MSNESIAYALQMDEVLRQIYLSNYPSFEQFLAVLNAELGTDRLFDPVESTKKLVRVSTVSHAEPDDRVLSVIEDHPMTLWSAYEKLIHNHNVTIQMDEGDWYDFTIDKFNYEIGEITDLALKVKTSD